MLSQEFQQVDKDADGCVKVQSVMDVRYVPLTDKEHQLSRRR